MTDLGSIIQELEQQRDAIDRALAALRGVGGSDRTTSKAAAKATSTPRKLQMSEAGRKRIAEATRRRWAAKRAIEAASKKAGLKQPTAKKELPSKKIPSKKSKAPATAKKTVRGAPEVKA
jgi:hypothetical protein